MALEFTEARFADCIVFLTVWLAAVDTPWIFVRCAASLLTAALRSDL
jgi:hypothetical protein